MFVWALIFSVFSVPAAYQHWLLFYGIFGALVLRGGFVGVKFLLTEIVDIGPGISLLAIVIVLGSAIGASLWRDRRTV